MRAKSGKLKTKVIVGLSRVKIRLVKIDQEVASGISNKMKLS